MPSRRRWLTMSILALWVLLGPLTMAFGGCLAMADCEALCGVLPGLALGPVAAYLAAASSRFRSGALLVPRSFTLAVLEPPPRRALPA